MKDMQVSKLKTAIQQLDFNANNLEHMNKLIYDCYTAAIALMKNKNVMRFFSKNNFTTIGQRIEICVGFTKSGFRNKMNLPGFTLNVGLGKTLACIGMLLTDNLDWSKVTIDRFSKAIPVIVRDRLRMYCVQKGYYQKWKLAHESKFDTTYKFGGGGGGYGNIKISQKTVKQVYDMYDNIPGLSFSGGLLGYIKSVQQNQIGLANKQNQKEIKDLEIEEEEEGEVFSTKVTMPLSKDQPEKEG
jgi:hypothetical protein